MMVENSKFTDNNCAAAPAGDAEKAILKDGRRPFWTTQPAACGTRSGSCGFDRCGRPGLRIVRQKNTAAASLATNDFVRSLALNILLTQGAAEKRGCPMPPGNRGGHWSDSFTGARSGSILGRLPIEGSALTQAAALKAALKYDLQKMADYGVCDHVDVDVLYQSQQKFSAVIRFYLPGNMPAGSMVAGLENGSDGWKWQL